MALSKGPGSNEGKNNENGSTISKAEHDAIMDRMNNDDRTGAYVTAAQATGSQMMINEAQISSFSGFKGAVAEKANASIAADEGGNYYPGGVIAFSMDIAAVEFSKMKENLDGTFSFPAEKELFNAAADVWSGSVGKLSKDLSGSFPGNALVEHRGFMGLATPGAAYTAAAAIKADFEMHTNYGPFTVTVDTQYSNKGAAFTSPTTIGKESWTQEFDFEGKTKGIHKDGEYTGNFGMQALSGPEHWAGPNNTISNFDMQNVMGYNPTMGPVGAVKGQNVGSGYTEIATPNYGAAPAPTAPSIASTLDMHGVAAPSVGLTGTVSVGGVAHSNFGSISIEALGIGTPVGAVPASNFATPSLAAAMEMQAQQAAAAAAAAARHEAFVAQTAMEADMLNNQQLAEINAKHAVEATVDRWTAAMGIAAVEASNANYPRAA